MNQQMRHLNDRNAHCLAFHVISCALYFDVLQRSDDANDVNIQYLNSVITAHLPSPILQT